jgi:superfamily II DNA or RNA helicase
MADDLFHTKAWRVVDTEQFFDDFMNLPVCTVISTSQVAKNFATHTDEGDFIDFGEQRKWLPQIEVRKVNVPLPLEEQISQALDQGYFKHRVMSFKTRTGFQRTESTVEQQVNVAWMSSPIELQKVIAESIADSFQVDFIYPQEERRAVLGEIQDQLKQFSYMDDQKLQVLVASLRTFITEKRKIIIFTERHSTAVYLEQAIGELVQEAHIANVVRQTDTGYELKDFDNEVFNLILDFAPEANRDKQLGRAKALHPFNVFITTDAYSAGINLQDASVVISYDIAWTPETIIQRAGRILRFWTKPRTVSLYIFVGSFVHDIERQNTSKRVEQRIRKLVQRTRQAEKFSELPMIPEGETAEYKSLGNLSHVTIENLGLVDLTQIEEFPGYSRFLTHITELHQHMELAKSLQNDIASALRYKGKDHLVYILLHYQNDYVWILYNVVTRQLIHLKEDNLLDLLYCHQDDIPASVDANIVEVEAQNAKNLWIRKNKIEHPEAVERICAMYLLPDSIEESIALRTAFN